MKHSLKATVKRVLWKADDGSFQIISLRDAVVDGRHIGNLVAKGDAPQLNEGIEIEGGGTFVTDAKFGRQFKLSECLVSVPKTEKGIERYLSSGIIPGVGTHFAAKLVKHFGADTLDIVRNAPDRLRDVPGIGKKRAESLVAGAREFAALEAVMTFLMAHNLSKSLAFKVQALYGEKSFSVLQANPWLLASEIDGIGFLTADKVAESLGMSGAHPGRIEAGIIHRLNENEKSGSTAVPTVQLITRVAELLDLPQSQMAIRQKMDDMMKRKLIVETPCDGIPLIQKRATEATERYLAKGLKEMLLGSRVPWDVATMRGALSRQEVQMPWPFSNDQRAALERIINNPVSVLTGGPGTGKTTITGTFLKALRASHPRLRVKLCAPTGKAAQRLAESTGGIAEGLTTHRLLEASGSGFGRNRDNPLQVDLVIADEASMKDVRLAHSLVSAMPKGAALLLVGDVDQLPSVGAGAFLMDVIQSGVLPVSDLREIHRQAKESCIVTNAHAINHGEVKSIRRGHDFGLNRVDSSEEVPQVVSDILQQKMRDMGCSLEDVMVLTSGHNGESGTIALNAHLRSVFNPSPPAIMKIGGTDFGVGDRVIVTANDYDLDVRNGNMGVITDIDNTNGVVKTRIDGVPVTWRRQQMTKLALGYCITVHKSQGSQAPLVVIVSDKAHYMLLERSLLYTAVTRASRHCELISRQNSAAIAIRNKRSRDRVTTLRSRLQGTDGAMPQAQHRSAGNHIGVGACAVGAPS